MTSYSPTGPFTNGSAPGISATFLNNLETFLGYAADSNITSDGSGNLNIPNTGHYNISGFNVMWSPSSTDLILNCPNAGGGHKFKVQVGGVTCFSIDSSGNVLYKGTIGQNNNP